MNEKRKNLLTVLLAGGFVLVFLFWSIFKPDAQRSVTERRALAQRPELTAGSVLSGKFMTDFESYTLDQFPLREDFRALKAFTALDVFRRLDNDGLYYDRGYLSKLDAALDEASVDNAAERFRRVYERYLGGGKIYLAVVPDKNYYTSDEYPKLDYDALISRITQRMDYATYIDLTGSLRLESYYHTDPHWDQAELLPAARTILQAMGAEQRDSYRTLRLDTPFYGAYYGQYALPVQPDDLRFLTSGTLEACRVYDYETDRWGSVYDPDKAAGDDGYEVFLDGSRSLLRIENPNASTTRELVIFRDSYGSSLAPLLVEGYAAVTLVDIRYLSPELLGRFVKFTDQDVLFLYSTTVLNSSGVLK